MTDTVKNEDVLLSERQKVQQQIAKDRQHAEQRREAALRREERIAKDKQKIPTEFNARNTTLIPQYIRYLVQDMIIKLPLDTPKIKTVAFDNYEHVGNATYAITAILPVTQSRAKVEELRRAIEENLRLNVKEVVVKQVQYAQKMLKQMPTTNIDDIITRSEPTIQFKFRSRTPDSSQFLNWCYQADMAALTLLKLTHLGLISETEYLERVDTMARGLRKYAAFVYESRRTAFEHLKELTKTDEQTQKEFNQVQSEVKENANIEINDEGELKEMANLDKEDQEGEQNEDTATEQTSSEE